MCQYKRLNVEMAEPSCPLLSWIGVSEMQLLLPSVIVLNNLISHKIHGDFVILNLLY